MERENRGRKNLSAWEQGCMYRKALDEGLYPSLRKLAEAVKVDVSLVSKSLALARLPESVVAAFRHRSTSNFAGLNLCRKPCRRIQTACCCAPSNCRNRVSD
jgi:hypothetical protein